jgi:hypothetical protein
LLATPMTRLPKKRAAIDLAVLLGPFQWLVIDLAQNVEGFSEFLDQEMKHNSGHYICACLVLAFGFQLPSAKRWELGIQIMSAKRHLLIKSLCYFRYSKYYLNALEKLEGYPANPEVYFKLSRALSGAIRPKLVAHASRLTNTYLKALIELPDAFLASRMLDVIGIQDDQKDAEMLLAIIIHIAHSLEAGPSDLMHSAITSLWAVRCLNSLDRWIEKWGNRIAQELNFPSPPFRGTKYFQPLSSVDAMIYEAEHMMNCLDGWIATVLKGEAYFYHWDGEKEATVLLEPTKNDSWQCSQVLGFENHPVNENAIKQIRQLVSKQQSSNRSSALNHSDGAIGPRLREIDFQLNS